MEKKVVFFDVDETLLNCKSMFSFLKFYVKNKYPRNFEIIYEEFNKQINEKVTQGIARDELNIFFYSLWKGFNQTEVKELSALWYAENKQNPDFFIPTSMNFLKKKKSEGYLIIAVSGSAYDILHEFVKDYEFSDYFFSKPIVINGLYSGEIHGYPMIGKNKKFAVTEYMSKNFIDPKKCFAVGDHESDLLMLKSVGQGYLFKNNELILI